MALCDVTRSVVIAMIVIIQVSGEESYTWNHCIWQRFPNTNAEGSFSAADNLELEDCLDLCHRMPDCVAVDYVRDIGECWWHTTPSDLDQLSESTSSDLYVRNATACSGDSEDQPYAFEDCNWRLRRNSYMDGSSLSSRDVDLDHCLSFCRHTASCWALDYVLGSRECWLHTSEPQSSPVTAESHGTRFYYMDPVCATIVPMNFSSQGCRWTKVKFTHAFGAKMQSPGSNLTACLLQCQSLLDCVGFDHDRIRQQCWFHMSQNELNSTDPQHETDLYIKHTDACATPEAPVIQENGCTWNKHINAHAPGSTEDYDRVDISSCMNYCQYNKNCSGFDFAPERRSCRIHTGSSPTPEIQIGTNLYVKLFHACPADPVKTIRHRDCPWTSYLYTQAGTPFRSYTETSLTECLDLCIDVPACSALDYQGRNGQCHLHMGTISTGDYTPTLLFHHYVRGLVRNCRSAGHQLYAHDGCTWEVRLATHSTGPSQQQSGVPLNACLEHCRDSTGCVGVDYNSGSESCWWHSVVELEPQENVDFYHLNMTCASRNQEYALNGCVWTQRNNTHGVGSTTRLEVVSLDECLTFCRNNVTCTAADVMGGYTDGFCLLHFGELLHTEIQSGSMHYVIQQTSECGRQGTGPVTTEGDTDEETTTVQSLGNTCAVPSFTAVITAIVLLRTAY